MTKEYHNVTIDCMYVKETAKYEGGYALEETRPEA